MGISIKVASFNLSVINPLIEKPHEIFFVPPCLFGYLFAFA